MNLLDTKLIAILCRSSMGIHMMWDDGLVQIKLTDNDYINCSKKEPFYTDWCDTVEQAVDQILQHMEKLQIERFDGNCIPIFQNLIEVKQPIKDADTNSQLVIV